MIEEHEWTRLEKAIEDKTELGAIKGAKAAVVEHMKVTHKPLDEKVADIKESGKFNVRLMLIIACVCAAIGSLIGAAF